MAITEGAQFVPLITEHEAARHLRLAVATLRKWRVHGGGPRYIKLSRAVRYDPADLAEWVAARRFDSTTAAEAAVS